MTYSNKKKHFIFIWLTEWMYILSVHLFKSKFEKTSQGQEWEKLVSVIMTVNCGVYTLFMFCHGFHSAQFLYLTSHYWYRYIYIYISIQNCNSSRELKHESDWFEKISRASFVDIHQIIYVCSEGNLIFKAPFHNWNHSTSELIAVNKKVQNVYCVCWNTKRKDNVTYSIYEYLSFCWEQIWST